MKQFALAMLLALPLSPALAEDAAPPAEDGLNLIEEGAKMLLRGLMTEAQPAIEGMADALGDLEPALREFIPKLREILALVDDLGNYNAPEKLENGDIILRRKVPPALPALPDAPQTNL